MNNNNNKVTTTTKQINLHKLLNLQELRSPRNIPMSNLPLQELNMKWAEKCKGHLTWCSTALGHQMPVPGGVYLTVHCILNCILQNVKMTLCSTALGYQMPLLGGTSAWENLNTLCILCFASQRTFLWKANKKMLQTM